MFNLKACGLRQRIIDIFGKRLNQVLLPVDVDTTMCKVHGFVGKPESAKKKGAHQYFFVNGRFMKHPYFHKAVQMAFERLVPQGEQVPYFIYFDIQAEDIDVNIHPTKTEIKFENEQAIWQILTAAVKETIGKFNDVPSIDFDTEGCPDIPVFNPDNNLGAPKVKINTSYNPFKETTSAQAKSYSQWENLYEGLEKEAETEGDIFVSRTLRQETPDIITPEPQKESLIDEKSPAHYQYKGQYIMTAVKSGLMIIDQHRAHVRVLYEEYLDNLRARKMNSQKVLFPENIQLSAAEGLTLAKIMPEMQDMGFELTPMGGNVFSINAIPAGLDGINPTSLVQDMIISAMEKTGDVRDEINQNLSLSLARNAAIPLGQVLSNEEMEGIVNALFACNNPNYTPDGKNILCIIKQGEIEQLLG
jgi:DNA mismatch repair protein MutL